jgi:hypothetical protein
MCVQLGKPGISGLAAATLTRRRPAPRAIHFLCIYLHLRENTSPPFPPGLQAGSSDFDKEEVYRLTYEVFRARPFATRTQLRHMLVQHFGLDCAEELRAHVAGAAGVKLNVLLDRVRPGTWWIVCMGVRSGIYQHGEVKLNVLLNRVRRGN